METTATTLASRPSVAGLDFLKPDEVMPALGFTPTERKNFWEMVHAEGCPVTRLNRRRLVFERSALVAWLQSRTAGRLPGA